MADQTEQVIAFVRNMHPEIPVRTIEKCVAAMSAWVAQEVERDHVDS